MTVTAIREKLHEYINTADDKQIHAIYNLFEDQMVNEPYDWSKDEEFVAELDERVRRYEAGIDKGYTLDEVKAHFDELRKERYKGSSK